MHAQAHPFNRTIGHAHTHALKQEGMRTCEQADMQPAPADRHGSTHTITITTSTYVQRAWVMV